MLKTPSTFFLHCTLYSAQRVELLRQVSEYCTVTLDILLKGNALLSIESNQDIFVAVQNYILQPIGFKIFSFSYDILLLYSYFGSPLSFGTNVIEIIISVV